VQFGESNLKIIQFLTASNGLYYFFDGHFVVVSDTGYLNKIELDYSNTEMYDQIHKDISSIDEVSSIKHSEYQFFATNPDCPNLNLNKSVEVEGFGRMMEYKTNIVTNQSLSNYLQRAAKKSTSYYRLQTHDPEIRAGSLVKIRD
jgi:hypothetical protein